MRSLRFRPPPFLTLVLIASALSMSASLATAQTPPPAPPIPDDSATDATDRASSMVTVDTGDKDWIGARGPLSLEIPALDENDRLAILLGKTDLTDLFFRRDGQLVYRAELLPLPAGEHELIVLQRSADQPWTELHRQPLRVLHPGGTRAPTLGPSLELQASSQLDEGADPDEAVQPGSDEGSLQLSTDASFQKGAWTLRGSAQILGVSEKEKAIRFFQEGDDADQVDLASFLLRAERGRTFFEVGHTSYGTQRHLVAQFASRGLHFGVPLGQSLTFVGAAMAGTQTVGWDNLLGLERSADQLVSGTLAWNAVAKRPGALLVEATWMDGSRLPLTPVNQGFVNDREENDGVAFRISGQPHSRVRFDAGWSRSSFVNPSDPLLFDPNQIGAGDVVAVEEEERDSWYGELELTLYEGQIGPRDWFSQVALRLTHDHTEPLYRSIAASPQADLEQSSGSLRALIGPLNAEVGHTRMQDNLDDIESILETKTRRRNLNLAVPLAQAFNGKAKLTPWLPTLTYGYDRTRQFSDTLPINGDFSESHLPDQVNDSHNGLVEWSGNRWRFGAELSYSDQDNRQTGRELADFEQRNHRWFVNITPVTRLDLGFEYRREKAFSVAEQRTDRTRGPALRFLWRPTDRLSLTGDWSATESESESSDSDNELLTVEASYRLDFRQSRRPTIGGQWFLRYTDQSLRSRDTLFGLNFDNQSWALSTGLSLSLR